MAIKSAKTKHPGCGDGAGEAVAEAALEAAKLGHGCRHGRGLVDEAQDSSTPALEFVLSLLDGDGGDLVIVADAAQNIFLDASRLSSPSQSYVGTSGWRALPSIVTGR
jgi:hypothetical protein